MSFLNHLRKSRFLPVVALCVILGPVFPHPARADGVSANPTGQAGVYDPVLGVPETGAAISNGSVSPVSVNPSTGVASAAIPFQLPTARGVAQPSLGLTYSSEAGAGNGGWGWSLGTPAITRAPLAGPPTYGDPQGGTEFNPATGDRFAFNGLPLVPICTLGYSPCTDNVITASGYLERFPAPITTGWTYFRLETGADDARFFWSADHYTWLVQYKSGVTIELGRALGADQLTDAIDYDYTITTYQGRAGFSPPFRWNIARQYDAEMQNGVPVNRILYYWQAASVGVSGQLPNNGELRTYLTDIVYTLPTASASAPASFSAFADHVRLIWEDDEWSENAGIPATPFTVLQAPAWRARPHQVLARVDVSAVYDPDTTPPNGTTGGSAGASPYVRRLVRRYWLTHTPDKDYFTSNRVLLTSVQVEGRCPSVTDLENSTFSISATTNCPRLPATTYGYTQPIQQFAATPLTSAPNTSGQQATFIDFNSVACRTCS